MQIYPPKKYELPDAQTLNNVYVSKAKSKHISGIIDTFVRSSSQHIFAFKDVDPKILQTELPLLITEILKKCESNRKY